MAKKQAEAEVEAAVDEKLEVDDAKLIIFGRPQAVMAGNEPMPGKPVMLKLKEGRSTFTYRGIKYEKGKKKAAPKGLKVGEIRWLCRHGFEVVE